VTARATGRFDLTWDEKPAYDDAEGATLAEVTITKKFHGDLSGTSLTRLIRAMTPIKESAAYVAIERVNATLHGRAGTFVLQHSATMGRGERSLAITVVPDSATGELTGLLGRLMVNNADGEHQYTFEYTLDDAGSDAE